MRLPRRPRAWHRIAAFVAASAGRSRQEGQARRAAARRAAPTAGSRARRFILAIPRPACIPNV